MLALLHGIKKTTSKIPRQNSFIFDRTWRWDILHPLTHCSDWPMLEVDASLFSRAAKRAFQVRVQKSNAPFSYTRLHWLACCSWYSSCLHKAAQTTTRCSLATFNSSSLISWLSYFHFKDSITTTFKDTWTVKCLVKYTSFRTREERN